ncbi:MAG: MFS transporter [Planctomycetota bacterium]
MSDGDSGTAGKNSADPERRSLLDAWKDNPEWRKLYAARTVSLFGDWINLFAILHLIGQGNHGSALAFAVVFVLKLLPMFLLGPAAGVVADRFHRKKILIACNLLACAVVLCFLFAEQVGAISYIYLLAGLQLSVMAFFEPARQALIPSLVQKRDLLAANALSSATWSIVYALGAAAGGLILHFFGWQVAILVDAFSYVISAAFVMTVAWEPEARAHARTVATPSGLLGLEDFALGLRYILGNSQVRSVIFVKFGWGMMGALTLFLTLLGMTPEYRMLGAPELGFSYLFMCRALGTGFGPFLARWYAGDDQERLERAISLSYFAAPTLYALVTLTHDPVVGGLVIFAAHLGGSTLWVISTVLLMQIVPDRYRGRTFAADLGLFMLTATASQLGYAALIDHSRLGLRGAMALAGGVCLIPALIWLRGRARRQGARDAVVRDTGFREPG